MGQTSIDKQRKHYRASQGVWGLIRDGWEKGYPVVLLAAHYGAGRTTIHKRAKAEGWKRPEAPEPAPLPHLRVAQRTTQGRGGSRRPGNRGAAPEFGDPIETVVGGEAEGAPRTLAEAIERAIRFTVASVGEENLATAAGAALLAERLLRLKAAQADAAPAAFAPAGDVIARLAARFGVEARP